MNYIFIGKGFEEIEAITTIDLLRRANIALRLVSLEDELTVMGAHQVQVICDCLFKDTDFQDAETLILPGGAVDYFSREALHEVLLQHNAENKRIAAICAAPSILGHLGILKGKQAVCYPGFEKYLGESYLGGLVVESKNIITAKGPGLSSDFAFCIIERLAGEEIADQIYDAAQY